MSTFCLSFFSGGYPGAQGETLLTSSPPSLLLPGSCEWLQRNLRSMFPGMQALLLLVPHTADSTPAQSPSPVPASHFPMVPLPVVPYASSPAPMPAPAPAPVVRGLVRPPARAPARAPAAPVPVAPSSVSTAPKQALTALVPAATAPESAPAAPPAPVSGIEGEKSPYPKAPIRAHAVQLRARNYSLPPPSFHGVWERSAGKSFVACFQCKAGSKKRYTFGIWSSGECSADHGVPEEVALEICKTAAGECVEGYLYARELTYPFDTHEKVSCTLKQTAFLTEKQMQRMREEKAKMSAQEWRGLVENPLVTGFRRWFMDRVSTGTHPDLGDPSS